VVLQKTKTFTHLNDRSAYTWLLNIMSSNEFMFLYLDHGIALAQAVHIRTDMSSQGLS
jgi:hypothetical protein